MFRVYITKQKHESSLFNNVVKKHLRILRAPLRRGVVTIIQNVTREKEVIHELEVQKRQLEEKTAELESQTSLLNNILKNSSNGISVSKVFRDETGKVTDALTIMANDAAVKYIGFSKEDYLTKRATEIEPEVMTSPYYQMCIRTLETGEPFITQYYVNATKRWLELTVSRLDYDHLIQIFTDVTQIKESQLELEHTVQALQRSNAYLQDFAHVASHDMKEPLRKILTFTERLRLSIGSQLNEREAVYFDRIQNSSQRMVQLIDDILAFSHVNLDNSKHESVNLHEQLNIVLSDLEVTLEEKQANVRIQNKLPVIKGNQRQLQQLFQNILSNSLKYSKAEEPPVIDISSRVIKGKDADVPILPENGEREYHFIDIKDNGIGFPQEHAHKIFDMLQRLHSKNQYSGTGIGLSIVRKVVENHGGYIWAVSNPGEGATFNIILPAMEPGGEK